MPARLKKDEEKRPKKKKKKNCLVLILIAAFYVSVVGAPCTALPAEYAATSTGVDCFFIHASRSFFFSVMISPMPMVLDPLSFFIKSLVVVCACKSRQVGSFLV